MATMQRVLDTADGNFLNPALQSLGTAKGGLGSTLRGIHPSSEVTDSGTIPADTSYVAVLTKLPIPGTLRVATGANALAEYVGASAVAAGQFKTSVSSGVMTVTVHSGQASAAYVIKYLTLDWAGDAAETPAYTTAELAAEFPAAPSPA